MGYHGCIQVFYRCGKCKKYGARIYEFMDHGKQYVKGCYKTVDIYKQKIEVKDSGDEYTLDWVQEIYDSMPKYNKEDFNWCKNNCQHFAL